MLVDEAQEVATNLMFYVERLAAADAFMDKAIETAVIQHLSEMAKALMLACRQAAVQGVLAERAKGDIKSPFLWAMHGLL